MSNASSEVLLIARRKCYERPLLLSMGATSKQGTHCMVKELAMWDHIIDNIFTFALDADFCDGTHLRTAKAVDYSLKKVVSDGFKAKLKANAADVSVDGDVEGLHDELNMQVRDLEDGSYHSCSLYDLNLMRSNVITKCFGTGVMKNHNSLQLFLAC